MKKKVLIVTVLLIALLLTAVGGTLAYYTAEGRARNVITTGTIGVEVTETCLNEAGEEVLYPEEPVDIMPGVSVSKIVRITAAADSAQCWVRAKVEVVIRDASGAEMPHTEEELAQIMTVDAGGESWTERDGWFYYAEAVEGGETTDVLMREVAFSGPNMTNRYQGGIVEILVTAQAVQTAHNGTAAVDAVWTES